jgi:hypothetical protein
MSGLDALGRLVGAWEIEASHPMLEGAVQGRIEVEWLEGEKFLLHRSPNDQPEAPGSISVIRDFEDVGLTMHYFDSRGAHRVHRMSFGDGDGSSGATRGAFPAFRRHAQRGRQRARRAVRALDRRLDLD